MSFGRYTTLIVVLAALLVSTRIALGQLDISQYSAPVSWNQYLISNQNLSIMFPKVPVPRKDGGFSCTEVDGQLFHAYAGGVVYEFEVYSKSAEKLPSWCTTKTKFSRDAFANRIAEHKNESWSYQESKDTVDGLSATVLRSTASIGVNKRTRWLIWDKDRWFEVGVTHRPETPVDEQRILAGIRRNTTTGTNIGVGSLATLGDPDVGVKTEGKTKAGITIVTKPRPGYTEAARQSNIQGTVILRVTFLRNGGIGAVSVVKALPLGLTEMAMAAAKKIAFLPAISEGATVHVTKQVEYTFTIY